ncbi:MAG: FtsX-like permease family protein [Sphingobacteriales bacterium]|nr:MAG: FtsX-like permease family protein [Sphingobacteriales bacterium]
MLAIIAFLILLIGWFNYINLSTAASIKRANEVGVRKVIGASRGQLVRQFLTESVLVNVLAFITAMLLIILLQPFFNRIVGKELSFSTLLHSAGWIYAALLLVMGALLSGAYTAFALAGLNPIKTLKGQMNKTGKGVFLRKSLVVSQFAISIGLIIAALFIYAQLSYMQNKNLGINTSGKFGGVQANIQFNPQQLDKSSIEASVDVSTVNSDNDTRDRHLKGAKFFDADHYPTLSLKSVSFQRRGSNSFTGKFNLTIKGVTKPVDFPFNYTEANGKITYNGSFKINRKDYNVGGNSMVLADEVTISIMAETAAGTSK